MFTFVTNVTERVAAQLARDANAGFIFTTTNDDGLTSVTVADHDATAVAASFRRSHTWMDRVSPPSERTAIGRPIVTKAAACTIRRADAWQRDPKNGDPR